MPLGEVVPLERGRQRGVPPKIHYFATIGSYSVKTAADRYRHMLLIITSNGDGLFRFINIDDLQRLEPPKQGLVVNFVIFGCSAHFEK